MMVLVYIDETMEKLKAHSFGEELRERKVKLLHPSFRILVAAPDARGNIG